MSSRHDEIESFLDYYARIFEQNPSLDIYEGTFYDGLKGFDTGKDHRKSMKHLFDGWEKLFDRSNLLVYVHAAQSRFIQFHNNKHKSEENLHDYKLYVNLPPEYLDAGVRKIFGFINKNNIETYSKVADTVRADGIVLRIPDSEDMLKVVNFINSNPMLSKVARRPNPFLQRYGVVGAAYDKLESYNSTVCKVLVEYFSEKRRTKTMGQVSLEDFQKFVRDFYKRVFSDMTEMHKFFNIQDVAAYRKRHDCIEDQILNYRQMIELIGIGIERDMSMDEYVKRIKGYQDVYQEALEEDKIHRIYNGEKVKDNRGQQQTVPLGQKENENNIGEYSVTKQTLDGYIRYAIEKYGVGNTPKYLDSYVKGSKEAITRDRNYRNIFTQKITPEIILDIANYNIEEYVANLYRRENLSKYELFINASTATLQKYDRFQLETAVREALNGEFKYISNDGANAYRSRIRSECTPKELRNICECYLLLNGLKPDIKNLAENFAYLIEMQQDMNQVKSA